MQFKSKLLIVDDDATNRKILRLRLQDRYELREACSGEEALEILKEFNPILILLDIMMDGIDGYEVTRSIRRTESLSSAKVILVSGKALLEDRAEGYRSGADDYITKPFHCEELKVKVGNFEKLGRLEVEVADLNVAIKLLIAA